MNNNKEIRNVNPELLGDLIEQVEDFLSDYGVKLPRSEEEKKADGEDADQTVIYGSDYGELQDRFSEVIRRWSKGNAVLPYTDWNGDPVPPEIRVKTPAGEIVAEVSSDSDYPGIWTYLDDKNQYHPAVLMEYSNTCRNFSADQHMQSCVAMYGYDSRTDHTDDPIWQHQATEDLIPGDDAGIEKLWDEFSKVPFETNAFGDHLLKEDWFIFHRGTLREDIWGWFSEHHSRGLDFLMKRGGRA